MFFLICTETAVEGQSVQNKNVTFVLFYFSYRVCVRAAQSVKTSIKTNIHGVNTHTHTHAQIITGHNNEPVDWDGSDFSLRLQLNLNHEKSTNSHSEKLIVAQNEAQCEQF